MLISTQPAIPFVEAGRRPDARPEALDRAPQRPDLEELQELEALDEAQRPRDLRRFFGRDEELEGDRAHEVDDEEARQIIHGDLARVHD